MNKLICILFMNKLIFDYVFIFFKSQGDNSIKEKSYSAFNVKMANQKRCPWTCILSKRNQRESRTDLLYKEILQPFSFKNNLRVKFRMLKLKPSKTEK